MKLYRSIQSRNRQNPHHVMKFLHDTKADTLYLRLDDSRIIESEEVSPGVVLDFNDADDVVGIEMHRISERSSKLDLSEIKIEEA